MTPYLFIGIGETSAFFTLREAYLHEWWIGGERCQEVRSFHHQNLSQDLDEAFAKAKVFAENMGLELKASQEGLNREMREIRRANAEELERRQRLREEQEERWAAERREKRERQITLIHNGIFPFGQYQGARFEYVPRGFLTWIVRSHDTFEEESLMRLIAIVLEERFSHLILPEPAHELHVGEPKQRLSFEVTVTRVYPYTRPSYSGYGEEVVYITTMISKEDQACLVCFSPAFSPNEGDELKIKATVKEHTWYNGQAQTVVQRVAVQ